NEALELFKPAKVFLLCKTDVSQELESVEVPDNSMIIVSCSDAGFTKSELALGTHVYPKYFNPGIGPVAEITLSLYTLASRTS
ncbi:MAG: RecB-family nuclease, partial [Sulfolobales archaeon]